MTEDKTTLSATEVDAELQTLAGWSRDGIIISRDFVFANFKDITSFLNHLTKTITDQNHHPDFSLDTGKRTIRAIATFHPAYLLRSPSYKRLSWQDLRAVATVLAV